MVVEDMEKSLSKLGIELLEKERNLLLIRAGEFLSSQGNFILEKNGNNHEWSGDVKVNDTTWPIKIIFTKLFPIAHPLFLCVKAASLYLKNPHIFPTGYICLFPSSASINCYLIEELLEKQLHNFKQIIKGATINGFKEEFLIYWNRSANHIYPHYLLTSPKKIENIFYFILIDNKFYIANDKKLIKEYLQNLGINITHFNLRKGICINLKKTLIPSEYPNNCIDVLNIAKDNDINSYNLICEKIIKYKNYNMLLIKQKTENNFSLGAIEFFPPKLFKNSVTKTETIISQNQEILLKTKVFRNSIIRRDYNWIHSRGGTGLDYSKKSVVIIGCGSVGGYIAHTLAKSGIGRILLIDNDKLEEGNIGRHILGTQYINSYKTDALKFYLSREMPHLHIESKVGDWLNLYSNDNNLFKNYDIVISTIANWKYEKYLNQLSLKGFIKTILFSWLETNAVAGHCYISSEKGCLNCHMDDSDCFKHAVTKITNNYLIREPGGCTFYQPYGPTTVLNLVSMTCKLTLKSLKTQIDSILYTWISDKDHFQDLKVNITDEWKELIKEKGFSTIYEKSLENNNCAICKND